MTLVFKSIYSVYRLFSFLRYWGYRRFTSAGLGALIALTLAAIIGPDTDNNVA